MPKTTITIRDDGPIVISGDAAVLDARGEPLPAAADGLVVLCRCGHSDRKPFCDGTHRRIGFESAMRPEGDAQPEA